MSMELPERFWAKVLKTNSCWLWTAAKNIGGYGAFKLNGKIHVAHRLSYEERHGPIPAGSVLDHTCHNPACVNPEHLRPATDKQNGENRGKLNSNNTSGVRGVFLRRDSGRWQAQIQHNRKSISLGTFKDLSDAEVAVVEARNRVFTHNDSDRERASQR